jgi:hypothetical protein
LFSISCNRKHNLSIEKQIPEIQAKQLHSILDSVNIILDTEINNIQIVSLETTSSSLIGGGAKYLVVTDDYILIENKQGLLQFDRKGHFIRQIMRKGKGPNEFIYLMCPAPKNNYLLFSDMSKKGNSINKCDLDTGILTNFPLAIDGKIIDLIAITDSTIAIVNYHVEEQGLLDQISVQDTLGNLLFQKRMGDYYELDKRRAMRGFPRMQGFNNDGVIVESPYCDSISLFSEGELNPIFFIKEVPRMNLNKVYDDFLKISFVHYADNRLILRRNLESITNKRMKPIDSRLVMIELDNLNPSIVLSYQIPEFNISIDPNDITYENKTIGVVEFSAMDFKEIIKTALLGSDLAPDKLEKLKEMDDNITVNDNPILIIWDI